MSVILWCYHCIDDWPVLQVPITMFSGKDASTKSILTKGKVWDLLQSWQVEPLTASRVQCD